MLAIAGAVVTGIVHVVAHLHCLVAGFHGAHARPKVAHVILIELLRVLVAQEASEIVWNGSWSIKKKNFFFNFGEIKLFLAILLF